MTITQTIFFIVILVITIPLGFALYQLRKAEEEAERRQKTVLDETLLLKGHNEGDKSGV
jgi:hypothetical protein